MTIGIIGTGFVGMAYARYFQGIGAFRVIKYSLDPMYRGNKERIAECDLTLVCVPTPTTPEGQDLTAVHEVMPLIGAGQIAVIKSTVLPGTADALQRAYPAIRVLSSPEFLSEDTADQDVKSPIFTLIGMPKEDRSAVLEFLAVMPHEPTRTFTVKAAEAELLKYAHNLSGYLNILLYNVLYDATAHLDVDWGVFRAVLRDDPYLAAHYSQPVHKGGRGAGGHCFPKDFEAFRKFMGDCASADFLRSASWYNEGLLEASGKDVSELSYRGSKR